MCTVLVPGNGSGRSRRKTGIYAHALATTQAFAVEAGQAICGYPRSLADTEISNGAAA